MNNMNESGRSMVEMLGVLAIIGVLSVMGIAGYTQAMKKYKANEAAQEITMGAMLCGTTGSLGGFQGKYATLSCTDEGQEGSSVTFSISDTNGINVSAVHALLGITTGGVGTSGDSTFSIVS